uniref:Biotin-protein ligase N-terminal domain-containing protein n=2 Tax=Spongospora subterranea TaxID=70186 RepID=A0A0H5RQZ5_9EUKA|eukprot:CRZ11144.1 hypothetical protein [Spongospora subterranea]
MKIVPDWDLTSSTTLYYNGGAYFQLSSNDESTRILARYEQQSDRAAIVLVKVGKGKALLSGVHFEFDPESAFPDEPEGKPLVNELRQHDQHRRAFVQELLKRVGF